MKRIVLLLIFTLILGTSITLVSCGNNSDCAHNWQDATTSQPKTCTLCGKTEGEPLSAYEALNDDEKEVYHALVKFSSTVDNPMAVKLIELKVDDYSYDTGVVMIKLMANNAFGSPVTEIYKMNEEGELVFVYLDDYRWAYKWPHDGSVRKINDALQEYFKSMGW